MVNESECSKKFKKICDKSVASTEKEVRTAKEYSKLWTNYSTIQNVCYENTKKLNTVNLMLKKQSQNVETLKEIDNNREEELQKVKDEIKELQKKIISLENNEARAERMKSFQQKLLQESILKQFTMTYISDEHFPHLIRGFTANNDDSKMIPFEIVSDRHTRADIEDILWENSLRSSRYAKEWEQIFKTDPE